MVSRSLREIIFSLLYFVFFIFHSFLYFCIMKVFGRIILAMTALMAVQHAPVMVPGHVRLREASILELMNTYIILHTIVPYFCSSHWHLLTWHSLTVVPRSAYYWREPQLLLAFSPKHQYFLPLTPIGFAPDANSN